MEGLSPVILTGTRKLSIIMTEDGRDTIYGDRADKQRQAQFVDNEYNNEEVWFWVYNHCVMSVFTVRAGYSVRFRLVSKAI